MICGGVSGFGWNYTNVAYNTSGTSVTPGASDAEGSWTQIAASASITEDVCLIYLVVSSGFTSAQIKDHLLDLGIDEAGGTSYTAIVSNLICGQAADAINGARHFILPIKIKSGSAVAVRIQGSNATADTVTVGAFFYGKPTRPHNIRVAQYSETVGTITGSAGVSFTPGNSGSEGSWTSLGTTSKDLWWWQLCTQTTDSSSNGRLYTFDLAYGDASNKHMILENVRIILRGTAEEYHSWPQIAGYCEVPAGATLYVRGTCSNANETGHNAVAVGFGG